MGYRTTYRKTTVRCSECRGVTGRMDEAKIRQGGIVSSEKKN